nr:ulp1 protease family, C-terminal catalytic domain-containing protein [Tanacetum cinerariifolium]
MMKRKSKQLVLKVRIIKLVLKVKRKKSKIFDDENNKNSKIRTRTTPTTLFNAMAILNGDREKCLHEIGFGSMIGMGIHELPGKLGFYVIDNLDTETNVLSLTDSSILVTSKSVNDILKIPMGGCLIESLEPRTPDDPFIKEWLSQFGEKTKIQPNDISDVIVSTKDAGKLFEMNFLMLFANTMGLCETSGLWYLHSTKCDEFDVIHQTLAIRNWKSVQMKHQEKLEIEKFGGLGMLAKHEDLNLQSKDFVEMILAKFKNIHHDLRSLSEELYEGLSRFPDCVKLNELNKKFQEDLCNKVLARNEMVRMKMLQIRLRLQMLPSHHRLHRTRYIKEEEKVFQKKKKIDSFVCNVNKSGAEYTKDNSNDKYSEDSHSAEEEKNTEDSGFVKTSLLKSVVVQRKLSGLMRINRHPLIDEGVQGKGMMNRKSKQLKSKISDENNKNSKIRTRTTSTALFNAMAILNGDRNKCLHEMGFGSMIGIGLHELLGKLDVNKSGAEYTEDNSNDKYSEDSHSAEEEKNTEDSGFVKTSLLKSVVVQRKLSGLMRINRHLLIDEGVQGKGMMNRKSKQLVLKEKEENTK